jgi:hypothetical protein|tara:strand:+ start:672 stop:974 length:303 start_codon:yes stop_codon:yes gene_type:complete
MTNKQLITNYLQGNGFVNKGLILQDVPEMSERSVYASSIDRCLRTMVAEGTLIKRKAGKGSEYCLANVQPSTLIEKQNERLKKERIEREIEIEQLNPTLW